eukprot:COSAG02_NODE_103_length_36570_cov_25.164487_12_plen_102_part_00
MLERCWRATVRACAGVRGLATARTLAAAARGDSWREPRSIGGIQPQTASAASAADVLSTIQTVPPLLSVGRSARPIRAEIEDVGAEATEDAAHTAAEGPWR